LGSFLASADIKQFGKAVCRFFISSSFGLLARVSHLRDIMKVTTFSSVFPRQLRFWSFHCVMNALPSFGIASFYLRLWKNPPALVAMASAIGVFVLLFAVLTSLPGPLSWPDHPLSRALNKGTRIRSGIAAFSLLGLLQEGWIGFMPDLWAGMIAVSATNPMFNRGFESAEMNTNQILAVTLVEGFVITFSLVAISFFVLMAQQWRGRRKGIKGIDGPFPKQA
jgi:hypothetical protein